MTVLFTDDLEDDQLRRARIYAGNLCLHAPTRSSLELCEFAAAMVKEAFPGMDPEYAQFELPVEKYAEILAQLKPRFIHHPESKRLIRALLIELHCDPEETYFDVPRLRTVTSNDYLTTGIAYAFHPHRDTWYSAPLSQLNFWFPVLRIEETNAMAFHPRYFSQGLKNSSADYNYQRWNATSRFNAAQHVKTDTRVQPRALEPVELEPNICVLPPVGGLLMFSAAQLHSTIPNSSGRTRFSIDFRTVNRGDLEAVRGARNVDSHCTGSALPDFLRLSDLSHLPQEIIDRYLQGHPQRIQARLRPIRRPEAEPG
jgi:hypothetical protein